MNLKRKMRKGFTLVELVVVIAVIAVLAAVSVGAYFGVTDSAKSSTATSYLKQVKDLWMVYAAGEYDDSQSEALNAELFAADYVSYNGIETSINYRTVKYNPNGKTNTQNNNLEEAILFKVETEYPTWFLVDNKRIVESSDVFKTEELFMNGVKNSKYIIPNDENDDFGVNTFMLFTMTDVNDSSKTVRGFKYVKYVVNHINSDGSVDGEPYVYVAPHSTPLRYINDTTNVNYAMDQKVTIAEYPENTSLYLFKNAESNEDYNTEVAQVLENIYSEKAVVDGKEVNRGYVCGTIYVNRINNMKALNTENYPAYYIDNSSGNPVHKFYNDVDDLIGKLIKNTTTNPSYIFVDNTTLNGELTVIGNHKLIVDFVTTNKGNDLTSFSNITDLKTGRISHGQVINQETGEEITAEIAGSRASYGEYRMLDSDERNRNDLALSNGLSYKFDDELQQEIEGEVISTKTKTFVNEGVINIQQGAELMVEAYVSHASAQRGSGLKQYAEINNKGTINLNNGSMRSLGKIIGTGNINATGSSIVYDLFKFTSFLGGTISANCITQKVFPFSDYVIDNIQCPVILNDDSIYNLMGCAYAEYKFNALNVDFVNLTNSSEGIFYSKEESKIVLKYDQERKTKVFEFTEGNFEVGNVKFDLGLIEKYGIELDIKTNSLLYNFPISNIDVTICENSTLRMGDSRDLVMKSHSYRDPADNKRKDFYHYKEGGRNVTLSFMPSSSLTIEGELILGETQISNKVHGIDKTCGCTLKQRDIEFSLLEVALKADYTKDTAILFHNYNIDQLDHIISNFPTTFGDASMVRNDYQLQIFKYYRDNIDFWNRNGDSCLTVSEDAKITLEEYEIFDEIVTSDAKIYLKNEISNGQISKTEIASTPYEYKYLSAFQFLTKELLTDFMLPWGQTNAFGTSTIDYFTYTYII